MTKRVQSPIVIAISVLLLVTGLALAAPQGQRDQSSGARGFGAGGHGPGGAGRLMSVFRQLDLTDEQREQLRTTAREQMEGELGDLTRNEIQARRDLQKLIHDPATEESAIVDAVQAHTVLAEQSAVARHRLIVSLFEILTEEQRAQALVLIDEMPDDFQRRGQGRRSGPPSGE